MLSIFILRSGPQQRPWVSLTLNTHTWPSQHKGCSQFVEMKKRYSNKPRWSKTIKMKPWKCSGWDEERYQDATIASAAHIATAARQEKEKMDKNIWKKQYCVVMWLCTWKFKLNIYNTDVVSINRSSITIFSSLSWENTWKSNRSTDGFVLAHSSQVLSIMVGKLWQQEVAGHIVFAVGKQSYDYSMTAKPWNSATMYRVSLLASISLI